MAPARDRRQCRAIADHVCRARGAAPDRARAFLAQRLRRLARPVREGNAAAKQFQLDVHGEVVDAMYQAQRAGIEISEPDWRTQVELLNFLESKWSDPDEGIWEVRGDPEQFTHSKVMAWVAFDRAVNLVAHHGCGGNDHLERWKGLRNQIHREVCEKGYHPKKKALLRPTAPRQWMRVC